MASVRGLCLSGLLISILAACASTPSPTPAEPTRGPSGSDRNQVYIDETELVFLESYPLQIMLVVRGSLPTPCHQPHWEVVGPDEQGRIDVTLYSRTSGVGACIQVLEPLEVNIPLGSYTQGAYTVWLNGDKVQEFQLP